MANSKRTKTTDPSRPARGRPRTGPATARGGRWRVNRDVVSQRLEDEILLVQLKTDCVYALNPTAARCWELLTSRKSLEAIERRLAQEFSVDRATLKRSLARLLCVLREKKLVRPAGKAP